MARTIPKYDAADDPSDPGKVDEYRIELITPMFGGGVEAGVNDMQMPIRATAIRGQLQFWWRATRGAAFATLEQMRARHREVWGATDKASPVKVEVADVKADSPVPSAEYRWDPKASGGKGGGRLSWRPPFAGQSNSLPYALFPFQGKAPPASPPATAEKSPALFIGKASFTLRLRYKPELEPDVKAAVWAWANFGGVGARTRRGCGSIRCDRLAPADAGKVGEWFKRSAAEHLPASPLAGVAWPTMPRSLAVNGQPGDPIEAWDWTVDLLRHFRQGVGFARNEGQQPNRPGRSRYPEPETLREAMSSPRRQSGHQRLPAIPADAFPRAEFGLPIVFHFQGKGEPADTILQPKVEGDGEGRMASPIILKALALANGKAVPVILRLHAPTVKEVELLKGSQVVGTWGEGALRGERLSRYAGSPLQGLSSSGSALEAFLAFVREENFTEIHA